MMTAEAAPWLLAGFALAGLIHVGVSASRIARHLGGSSVGGVFKAAFLGVPLPLCSCSVIPVAAAIRRGGASRGATVSFLISTPETGVDSISLTWALLGPVMALLRVIAAFTSAAVAGLLVNHFDTHDPPALRSGEAASCAGCCGSHSVEPGWRDGRWAIRAIEALRYGFVDMLVDLAPWLLIGFLLAGLISAAVPENIVHRAAGPGLPAMLLALAIGLPLYVCATSSTPVAAALMAKGLSPGTALVFLLAGPATNVTTMAVVAKELGHRCLVIYLLSISVVALTLGLLVDWLMLWPAISAVGTGMGQAIKSVHLLEAAAAVLFICLLLNGLWLRWRQTRPFGG